MLLPETGSVVAVQYKRNPHAYSDAALNPRLFLGRVIRHEGSWGFTAALMNFDNVAQETWLEFDQEDQKWDDRQFQQPVADVRFPVEGDLLALFTELENLPPELSLPGDGGRPFDEMRLRFLLGAAEAGWLNAPTEPAVYFSDDFPEAASTVARWQKQVLGRCEFSPDRIYIEWPIDDKDPADCGIGLLRQENGSFYAKSEEFGDEFEARFETRATARVLCGLWSGEEFLSFFGAIIPNPSSPGTK